MGRVVKKLEETEGNGMVEGFVLDTTPQEETRQEIPMAKIEPEAAKPAYHHYDDHEPVNCLRNERVIVRCVFDKGTG